jgi:hypothetical protein
LTCTEGRSFAGTSAIIGLGGAVRLNKNATYKRIRNSGEWLQRLCVNLFRREGLAVEKPPWLAGKTVCLAPFYGAGNNPTYDRRVISV